MLPVKIPRKDPAPSRIMYRLERLWLRPFVQKSVRVYLPALAIGLAIGMIVTEPKVQGFVTAQYATLSEGIAARPELSVVEAQISGAGPELTKRIEAALALSLPISALKLDLGVMQQNVMALDPILSARLRVQESGVLIVEVTERQPKIVWRNTDGLQLIDETGAHVDSIAERGLRNDLPLIAGVGADRQVEEALRLLQIADPIGERVRGLVRVGERRWDLVLDRGLVVRLPEENPDSALSRVIALDSADDLLDRDIVVVDMRDKRRPLLQLSEPALKALHEPQLSESEGEDV